MFLNNKYTAFYNKIIVNAKALNRIKRRTTHHNYVYYECHHIIPRCLGGSNDLENLVILTSREHFLCHALLVKMIPKGHPKWYSVVQAFVQMRAGSVTGKRYFNARLYEIARRSIGEAMSILQMGEKNSQYGTTWVSHVGKRLCSKVRSDEVDAYIALGYEHRRIINFDRPDLIEHLARKPKRDHEKERERYDIRKAREIELGPKAKENNAVRDERRRTAKIQVLTGKIIMLEAQRDKLLNRQ